MVGLLSLTTTIFAQGIYIGPRVGATFADINFDGDEDLDPDSRTSVLFGGVLELALSDNFAIQPEVSYISRGYDGLGNNTSLFDNTLTLNYIDFGGLLKFKTGSSEQLSAYIGAGPYYSYLVSGEIGNTDIDFDADETFERGDWTAAFAAGVQLPIGESYLFLDARYLLGLTDVWDSDDDVEVNNRSFNISAGFMFPIVD